ncbi:pseudaminic acid cytidylyltransferase [Rubritalea marina]|uniref:pseudaminic acid cytidylyltransferase n=1 Tax=Rubritalea marina TaxID=361055 RepID=UPI0003AA75D3|nr:pseudaminic acid cytidylyltransferase [Rubritalea marina]
MKVAIIPARSGSKRIPHKNIKEFCGKPMIAWSIQAALQSGCFDHVVVSTDSEEIAMIAREYGATVPFLRPKDLSGDLVGTMPVLTHAVLEIEAVFGRHVDQGCCLYATAPFVTSELLQEGYSVLESDVSLEFAFSVATYPFPIQRALRLTGRGRVAMLEPENEKKRSQDFEECYHDAGQFYWFRRDAVFQNDGFFSARSTGVVIPRERVQDIDTPEDWRCAELAYELLEKKK